ncbi:MAG TPA: AMP-binding protein [Acidimicrobiia bacterium]|nr:AMP-binding protein [Acidimicrobiia bacterium]
MTDESFGGAWATVAELAPERLAIVCGERRLTFGELAARARALASALHANGLRAGDKVAIELVNSPEYLETFFAAQLLGCVPVNVNYRYVEDELAYLLDNSDAAAIVFHDDFASTVARAIEARVTPIAIARYQVRHAGAELTRGARWYDDVLAHGDATFVSDHEPNGDDLVFIYTGGTTGAPKAVMWRSADLATSLWQMARPGTEPPTARSTIERGRAAATVLPACPLMHGTGLFIALSTLSGGGTVVLVDSPRLDPVAVWDAVERESVRVLTIVGDAFARPLLEALEREPDRWDLGRLSAITSSGVTWSPETKHGLLARLPGITLIDSLGASEGLMTRNEAREAGDVKPAGFAASDRLVVVADDGTRCEAGDGRIGMLGVGGSIPLGYYKDPEKTAATFRTVEGHRYSIPGDYARIEADGMITLLGRGSACINTGGEKVYPEEVELALRSHPSVFDCVVVGVPSTRWGEMIVALVQPDTASPFDDDAVAAHLRTRIAAYKCPKRYVKLASLERSPAGKADYTHLRRVASEAVGEG